MPVSAAMLGNVAMVISCFLVGGVPVGLLIARANGIDDIRKYGSGNIGASNVLRTVGLKAGLEVWLVDVAKGALPTLLAGWVLGYGSWYHGAAAFATILGHCFSPYLGFRGGRGVASSLGVLLAIDWRVGLCVFGLWIGVTAATRYISLGSIVAALSAGAFYWLFNGTERMEMLVCAAAVGLLVTVRHAPNIGRLLSGTENKIGQKAAELAEESADGAAPDDT